MQQYILLNKATSIEKFLFDQIFSRMHDATHIIISLHHDGKYHFTMLYFDRFFGAWLHINLITPRRTGSQNKCYPDAIRMVCQTLYLFPNLII